MLAVALLAHRLPVVQGIVELQGWFRDAGLAGGIAYTFAYAVAVLLLLPGSLLSVGAGFIFGFAWGSLSVWLGSITGATAAFVFGRRGPRSRIEWLARRHPRFEAVRAAVTEKGWRAVALVRLSPIAPFTLSSYLFGLTDVPLSTFVMATAVAMAPGILIHVALGAAGGLAIARHPPGSLVWAGVGLSIAVGTAVTVFLSRAARRHLDADIST